MQQSDNDIFHNNLGFTGWPCHPNGPVINQINQNCELQGSDAAAVTAATTCAGPVAELL